MGDCIGLLGADTNFVAAQSTESDERARGSANLGSNPLPSGDAFAFSLQAVDLIAYFGNCRTNLLELDFLLGATLGPFAEVWSCTKASLSSLN